MCRFVMGHLDKVESPSRPMAVGRATKTWQRRWKTARDPSKRTDSVKDVSMHHNLLSKPAVMLHPKIALKLVTGCKMRVARCDIHWPLDPHSS